jgi:ubiquinone/menaquinone biosynthesis C-methylase UbiE
MTSAVAAPGGDGSAGIETIAESLACPGCKASLKIGPDSIDCNGCGARYPLRDGIALLAIRGTSETWGEPQANEQSAGYQGEYQRVDRAAAYNLSYRQRLLKRQSTRREFTLLRQLIGRVGRSKVILDLPCGGSRLTPAFAEAAGLVIEADIAHGQLLFGRAESSVATPRVWMTASAFHIPLRDNSVDGTICVRLSHHMPTAAERERLLAELLRVSRRFVIMTFFDHHSLKNLLRRLRSPFDRQPPKMTMTTARVAELAGERGARLITAPPLSRIGSGHRYALIAKDQGIV